MELQKFQYDNKTVKLFAYATILWGLVGMLVGLIAAIQLYLPAANLSFLGMATHYCIGRCNPNYG
jgi:cytochrome c oxidase cbb3-type subunit I/II